MRHFIALCVGAMLFCLPLMSGHADLASFLSTVAYAEPCIYAQHTKQQVFQELLPRIDMTQLNIIQRHMLHNAYEYHVRPHLPSSFSFEQFRYVHTTEAPQHKKREDEAFDGIIYNIECIAQNDPGRLDEAVAEAFHFLMGSQDDIHVDHPIYTYAVDHPRAMSVQQPGAQLRNQHDIHVTITS